MPKKKQAASYAELFRREAIRRNEAGLISQGPSEADERIRPTSALVVAIISCFFAALCANERSMSQDAPADTRQRFLKVMRTGGDFVRGGEVDVNWLPDSNSFWYVRGPRENAVFE
ncbi:MAG: hypothetical protein ACYS80_26020, partial [Planctomycetota bacterium]